MTNDSPKEHLATARLFAATRAPYFRAALMAMIPFEAHELGTVGVTKNLILVYDPKQIVQWTFEELAAVLIHEIGHVIRDHFGRGEIAGTDQDTWNIAGDCAINPDLTETGWKLPNFRRVEEQPDGSKQEIEVPHVMPKAYGLADGLTVEEYYNALMKKKQQQKSGGGQSKNKSKKKQGEPDKPSPGAGWCGSCGGKPLPNEPDSKKEPGRGPTDVDRLRRQVAEDVRDHAQNKRGNMPAGLERWAGEFLKTPKVRWQTKLARAARRCLVDVAGNVDYRYRNMSRRQAAVGFGPGSPVLPIMRRPKPTIAIAVDTSGSMGTTELEEALTEARGIMLAAGAHVQFLSCDADVHVAQSVQDWRKLPSLLKGGGGTDFRPVFEEINKRRNRPDVLIFLTDGMGPAPEKPPPYHTIWILLGPYKQSPAAWGESIMIEREDEKAA